MKLNQLEITVWLLFANLIRLSNAGLSKSVNGFVRDSGEEYQANGIDLVLLYSNAYQGVSAIGEFDAEVSGYKKSGESGTLVTWETQSYQISQTVSAKVHKQTYPNGIQNSTTGIRDDIISGWPCYNVETGLNVGFWSLGDHMFGWIQQKFGLWPKREDRAQIVTGLKSGPLILFDADANETTIYSRFDQFLVTHMTWHSFEPNGSAELCYGIMGNVSTVPEQYSVSFIEVTVHGLLSARSAFEEWGKIMTRYHGKTDAARKFDLTVNYVGYYTDNGAYYYYNTEEGKTYEQTVNDVVDHASFKEIPYKYLQYDSWFYPKDAQNNAVTQWVATAETFPDNLTAVFNRNMMPIVAHNRYFSPYNVYAKENGGTFDFILEDNIAIPADARLWKFLFQQSKVWGLTTYEQDWQNWILEESIATTSSLTAASDMFVEMGEAAQESGITVQYCMSLPKSALQSLLSNSVSQGRVSNDYQPGNEQWKIGESSMFAWAMNVAPFKDTFWTTTQQPNNTYEGEEPYPELQIMVAVLSCGPVGPSDKIGYEDRANIFKSITNDGLILKPDRPAFAIDKQILQQTGLIDDGPKGQVWSTYSQVGPYTHGIVFATDMQENYITSPEELGFHSETDSILYSDRFNWYRKLTKAEDRIPLMNCTMVEPCLMYTSPKLTRAGTDEKGRALPSVYVLGELSKWVPMSSKRFERVTVTYDDIILDIKGAADEYVYVTILLDSNGGPDLSYTMIGCYLDSAGRNQMSLKSSSCFDGHSFTSDARARNSKRVLLDRA